MLCGSKVAVFCFGSARMLLAILGLLLSSTRGMTTALPSDALADFSRQVHSAPCTVCESLRLLSRNILSLFHSLLQMNTPSQKEMYSLDFFCAVSRTGFSRVYCTSNSLLPPPPPPTHNRRRWWVYRSATAPITSDDLPRTAVVRPDRWAPNVTSKALQL